MINENLKAY